MLHYIHLKAEKIIPKMAINQISRSNPACALSTDQINAPDSVKGDYDVIAADIGTQLVVSQPLPSVLEKHFPTVKILTLIFTSCVRWA